MKNKEKICPKCASKNIVSDEDILPFCDDCGYILNQRKAKKEFEQEINEWEEEFLDYLTRKVK